MKKFFKKYLPVGLTLLFFSKNAFASSTVFFITPLGLILLIIILILIFKFFK